MSDHGPPPGAALEPAEVLARSGSNFRAAFVCLDAARREGMTAIYAFCRVADDAADDSPDAATGAAHLGYWREELRAAAEQRAVTPVGRALGSAMQRFGMPVGPLEALVDGCTMDLEPQAFADEAALRVYCDRVASAVGRACLPVLGAAGDEAVRFADALGQALQFTNILRDLEADTRTGRIYTPQSWLDECRVEPDWLAGTGPAAVYRDGGPVAALRARFVAVARREFGVAHEALRRLPWRMRRALVSARIMGAIYGDLLLRLQARGGDLRGDRVRVPGRRKLWLALLVFAGVRA